MYPTTYLQPGSSNRNSVKKLQSYLVNKGYMTQAQMNTGPGIYGPHTTRAVSALQRSLGVDTSGGGIGYFGPRTLKAVQGLNLKKPTLNLTRPSLNLNKPTLNLNTHIVKSGDTLSGIARANNTTVSALMQSNPQIKNQNLIYSGSQIKLPTQVKAQQNSTVNYSNGRGGTLSMNIQTSNGIKSSTGASDTWNAFNNKQLKDVYMFASPQEAVALKNFGISPKDWNSDSVIYGKSSPFAVNLLNKAQAKYNAQNATPVTSTTQSTTPAPVNIVDQTLKDFNTAIVNKDYTKLKQMGAIPATSATSTPLPVAQQVQTNTNPITLTTPTATQTPIPTIPTLTPEQVKATALSDRLQALNSSLVGKDAYQAQQNTSAGVDKVQQAINDNNLAIERLNASSGQAQLTSENRLAPMTQITGEQAQIARQRSFQMLGLSAISDALRNNLVSAQNKANEAVQLKYGAIEEQIKADTTNLSLVLNSPQATFDQKKQAQTMIDANRKKANDLIVNRSNQQEVFKVMTLSAQNKDNFTSTSSYPTLSTAMQAITDAKTPQEALVIATNVGLVGNKKSAGGFSLSQGQTRYDAQGNVIARAPAKPVQSKVSPVKLKVFINKQIATKSFQDLSATDKAMYIRSQGGDPYNFGF